jgi:hypothetical protein
VVETCWGVGRRGFWRFALMFQFRCSLVFEERKSRETGKFAFSFRSERIKGNWKVCFVCCGNPLLRG